MNITKYILAVSVALVVLYSAKGQSPMGLYFMETIPQSHQINPAMQPRANAFFSLPSVNTLFQSDMAFDDAFQEAGNEWITPLSERFDYSDFYGTIGEVANINQYGDVDILGIGFRSGRDYFTFSLGVRSVMQTGLPSDLFKIAELGFPDGESFDFSSTRIKQALYHELAFGYSREWNDKFTFGLKFKPLFGIVGGVTDIDRFQLNTSRTQWDMMVSGMVYSSAPIDVQEGAPGDFPESIDTRDLSDDEKTDYFKSLSNGGMAFDLGAVYRYDEQLTFSAAITNLGYVRFKDDLNSLSFNGTYSFEGINVEGSDEDEIEQAFEDIADSIKTIIEYDVKHEKFSVPLSPLLYVGGSYRLTPAVTFGLLSRSFFQKNNFRQDFNLSANLQPYNFVALNLNYGVSLNGGNGVGMGTSFLLGPLQLYFSADYIPTSYADVSFDDGDSFPMFYKQKDLSFRFGLNLIFGRHGYRDEPMLAGNR
ncbi:MAG: flagellar motor protein MotB [Anaerophaga sp.]|nr:flagellar motor protein MotB [Anaerophaga sp.]MDI3520131.1 hypothetical protein [Anaerophaga sp.]MDN5292450.1 hypothetical protein [Anaerophaga sp.]